MAITHAQKHKIEQLLMVNTPEEIYLMVIDGRLPRFPTGFWGMPENYKYALTCFKYLIEVILCWTPEECIEGLTASIIKEYKLNSPLSRLYNTSVAEIIMQLYPHIKPWQFPRIPIAYSTREVVIEATRWLMLEHLGYSLEEVAENWRIDLLVDYKVFGISTVYELGLDSNTLFAEAFPEIDIWSLGAIKRELLTPKLVGDKLREALDVFPEEERPQVFNCTFLDENNLNRCWYMEGLNSLHDMLELAYPGKYSVEDMGRRSNRYWHDKVNRREALLDLAENKLDWTPEECYNYLTHEILCENGLQSVYFACGASMEEVLSLMYPGMFDYSQLRSHRARLHNMRMRGEVFRDTF